METRKPLPTRSGTPTLEHAAPPGYDIILAFTRLHYRKEKWMAIDYVVEGKIATFVINRPEAYNAIDLLTLKQLHEAMVAFFVLASILGMLSHL